MRDLNEIFAALNKSVFRRKFQLRDRELENLRDKGEETVMSHAADFIEKRLAAANPPNDGRRMPLRNHPVFISQRVTAPCCRGCLEKWRGIARGVALTDE